MQTYPGDQQLTDAAAVHSELNFLFLVEDKLMSNVGHLYQFTDFINNNQNYFLEVRKQLQKHVCLWMIQ